jgi:proton glutamate symport protein
MKRLWSSLRSISLTKWILIFMVIGVLIGWLNPDLGTSLKPLSTVFLRLIKSIVVPIIFGSLVIGIAGHGDDMKRVGRLALKSIIYFEIITTIALVVGLVAVNLTRPGVGVRLSESAQQGQNLAQKTTSFGSFLEHIVPQSFFEAAASNEVLQIVVFAILFAVALSQVKGRPKESMLAFCEGLAETMFKFTGIVMKFAPIGIGAAIAVTVGHSGIGVLVNLGKLVLTLYGALVVFILVALVPAALIARVPLRAFMQLVKEPALIAFATTSSDAALPKAMQNMEQLGVSRRIVAFVIPTGYSFNLDGSTLYLAVASIFVAQAAGVELSVGQQIIMMLTLMVTSKGVAGVPRASLVILSGTLLYFNLPLEAVAIILGVDELMDMGRTTVNVIGNCLAAVIMGRWEGEFNPAATLAGHPIPAATSPAMAREPTGS